MGLKGMHNMRSNAEGGNGKTIWFYISYRSEHLENSIEWVKQSFTESLKAATWEINQKIPIMHHIKDNIL